MELPILEPSMILYSYQYPVPILVINMGGGELGFVSFLGEFIELDISQIFKVDCPIENINNMFWPSQCITIYDERY